MIFLLKRKPLPKVLVTVSVLYDESLRDMHDMPWIVGLPVCCAELSMASVDSDTKISKESKEKEVTCQDKFSDILACVLGPCLDNATHLLTPSTQLILSSP